MIKKTYQRINRFVVFKGAMIFFIRQDVSSTKKCTGADFKSVVNNSKYMFQQILVKKFKS